MNKTLYGAAAAVSLLIAAPAFADHNSLWGEGTAVDAQGVHSDRYETLAAGEDMSGFKAATVETGTIDFDSVGGSSSGGAGGSSGGGAGGGGNGNR